MTSHTIWWLCGFGSPWSKLRNSRTTHCYPQCGENLWNARNHHFVGCLWCCQKRKQDRAQSDDRGSTTHSAGMKGRRKILWFFVLDKNYGRVILVHNINQLVDERENVKCKACQCQNLYCNLLTKRQQVLLHAQVLSVVCSVDIPLYSKRKENLIVNENKHDWKHCYSKKQRHLRNLEE